MSRSAGFAVLFGAVVAVSVLALINVLARLDDVASGFVDPATLALGNAHVLLVHPELWAHGLGQMPEMARLVHIDAALTVTFLYLVLRRLPHRGERACPAVLGMRVLLGAFACYLAGWAWLARGTTPVAECGAWLAWMLIGLFYGALISLSCGVIDAAARRRDAGAARAAASLAA